MSLTFFGEAEHLDAIDRTVMFVAIKIFHNILYPLRASAKLRAFFFTVKFKVRNWYMILFFEVVLSSGMSLFLCSPLSESSILIQNLAKKLLKSWPILRATDHILSFMLQLAREDVFTRKWQRKLKRYQFRFFDRYQSRRTKIQLENTDTSCI